MAIPTGAAWLAKNERDWFDDGMSVQEKASPLVWGKQYTAKLHRPNDMDPTSWIVMLTHSSLKNLELRIMDIVLDGRAMSAHGTVLEIEVKAAARRLGAPRHHRMLRFVMESADNATTWAASISDAVTFAHRWLGAKSKNQEVAARALAERYRDRATRDPILVQKEDETFADIDVDGDGVVTRGEFDDFMETKASAALKTAVRGSELLSSSVFGGLHGRKAASATLVAGTSAASTGAAGSSGAASNVAAVTASAASSDGSGASGTGASGRATKTSSGSGCMVTLYLVALHAICIVLLAISIGGILSARGLGGAQVAPEPDGTCPVASSALPAAWDWGPGPDASLSPAERSNTLSSGDVTFSQLKGAWVTVFPTPLNAVQPTSIAVLWRALLASRRSPRASLGRSASVPAATAPAEAEAASAGTVSGAAARSETTRIAELEAMLRSQHSALSRMEVDYSDYARVSFMSLVSFSSVLYIGVE